MRKRITAYMVLAVLALSILFEHINIQGNAKASPERKRNPEVIRVGWYDYAGFYMQDENGYRSGYGYDYLQELARYGGWTYEYVEGTGRECLSMLENGEIDLLGMVMQTPGREDTMEFSALSMGTNFTVLCALSENIRYQAGNYAGFDGMRIGVLSGDARNTELMEYAMEHDFSYREVRYDTPEQMEEALFAKEVDAILTTDLRKATGKEQIIAQFSPVDFYLASQKGNDAIMDPVNAAMEQIAFSMKDFQSSLAHKYFWVDIGGSLAYTKEEKQYIENNPTIRVVLPSMREPLAYRTDSMYEGILIDIMNEVSARTGIGFEYLEAKNQTEGIQLLEEGKAEIIANVYNDYGWAEINSLYLSKPYMQLDYASIGRVGEDITGNDVRVAAVTGYRFSQDYIMRYYDGSQITWYDNEEACIDAVNQGEQDICFASTYVANDYLQRYEYRNLYYSLLNYTHGLSVGVLAGQSQMLLQVIDKAIASIDSGKINSVIVNNTMKRAAALSYMEIILRNPVPFVITLLLFGVVIVFLLAMLMVSSVNRRKNKELYRAKLAAERDSLTGLYNRLSFELMVEEALAAKGGKSVAFAMLDLDRFKQINDSMGHSFGDRVLVTLAKELKSYYERKKAYLCRMGGDEFAVFLPEISSYRQVMEEFEEFQQGLLVEKEKQMSIPCSIGFVMTPIKEDMNFIKLYEAADAALYEAKRCGRGNVRGKEIHLDIDEWREECRS